MKQHYKVYKDLYFRCLKSDSNYLSVIIRDLFFRIIYRKKIWAHQKVSISGVKNIKTSGRLSIGINYVGFIFRKDRTWLNIKGRLEIDGNYSIGRGCRFDIGESAIVKIGNGGYTNVNCTFIIMHKLIIGSKCVISWGCQFLDEDFHSINYYGKKNHDNSIVIGDNVWIGNGVKIYRGTVIPDNCVIASDSVVKGIFTTKNVLIGGNPAKILKEDVRWN